MLDEAEKESNSAFYERLKAQRDFFGRDERKLNAGLGVLGHIGRFSCFIYCEIL